MATHITDLPVDIVSKIIYAVAEAPDGARNVSRSMPACRLFLKASKSRIVRKAVCFDNAHISSRIKSFRNTTGLLYKCAKSYNSSAEFELAQIILKTSSKLVELDMNRARLGIFRNYRHRGRGKARVDGVMASFVTHFTPAPGTNPTPSQGTNPRPLIYHWEFVRGFILKSNRRGFCFMVNHIHNYIKLFTACHFHSADVQAFLDFVDLLFILATASANTVIIRINADKFVPMNRELLFPNENGGVRGPERDSIEEIRVEALHAFDVITPKLCG